MKIKINFKYVIAFLALLISYNSFAQLNNIPQDRTIIPLYEYLNYKDNDNLSYPENPYLKDIEGDLDKYLGNWKGTHDGNTFEFTITKVIDVFGENLYVDILVMRYKVTNASGEIIFDTYSKQRNSGLVPEGYFLARNRSYYCLNYEGENAGCGSQMGWLYLKPNTSNPNQMELNYQPWGQTEPDCEEYSTIEVFPLTTMALTKL